MNKKGFTLVELLVVVSILTILSVTGLVLFQSARGKAQEAKYRGDIDAIKKAYEKNYDPTLNNGQGGYKALSTNDFASGKIPSDKNGQSYVVTSQSNGVITSYAACINPQTGEMCTGPNSPTCACAVSTQGGGAQVSGFSNPSCDPYGILGNGLIGYWKIDEANGSTSLASSVSTNIATITGSPVWNSGVSCIKNGCIQNAGTAYARVVSPSSALSLQSTPFTLSAWIKLNNNTATQTIFGKDGRTDTGSTRGFIARIEGGKLTFIITPTGLSAGYQGVTSDGTVSANTWHLLSWVFIPNTSIALYIDDALDKSFSTTISSPRNNASPFDIGTSNTGEILNGFIDDARVYNRALSASEISFLYNGGTGCVPN